MKSFSNWVQENAFAAALTIASLYVYLPRPGRYISNGIIVPLLLLIGAALSRKIRKKIAFVYDRLWYQLKVSLGGVGVIAFLAYLVVALAGIPPPQPPPHGAQAGILPTPPPPISVFPVPATLPPPPIAEEAMKNDPELDLTEPRTMAIDELIAQLPVAEAVEDEYARIAYTPAMASPAAPTALRILNLAE